MTTAQQKVARRIALSAARRFVPVFLIGAVILAGSGGLFFWHETSALPVKGQATPPAVTVAYETPPLPPLPEKSAALPQNTAVAETRSSAVRAHAPLRPARRACGSQDGAAVAGTLPAQSIRIEHNSATDSIDPILLAAYQAYRTGDFVTAGKHYTEALKKSGLDQPPSRDALLGMAAVAQQQAQDVMALRYYSELLHLDPRDPIAHAGLYALLDTGDMASTESRLKILLAEHPRAAPLHFVLGNHYAQQSRWSEAQQAYFSASSIEPDHAQYAYNLAVALDHLGQHLFSAQHYRRALQLDEADQPRSGNATLDHQSIQQRLLQLTAP